MRLEHIDGVLMRHADGGYPYVYYALDGRELCVYCANGAHALGNEAHVGCAGPEDLGARKQCLQGDAQWCVVASDVNWESDVTCDDCSEKIPSAYGPNSHDEDADQPTDGVE